MKITNLLATTAMTVVLTAGVVAAQDLGSSSFSAGVSLLSPDQTGFLLGGTAEVTGLGSGAVVINADKAIFGMTGFANSTNDTATNTAPEAIAGSGVVTVFQFDRTVTASGSSVGAGRVVAKGDANASVAAVGSAYGDTLTNAIQGIDAGNVYTGQLSSTSNASSESAASLVGEGSTSVLAGLIGTSANFVGSTGTTVTTEQSGIAYSALSAFGDAAGTGINIAPGLSTFADLANNFDGLEPGQGTIGFTNTLALGKPIDLAVANVGGGTISLGATTGGFFGGGAATTGTAGFGSVFTAAPVTVTPIAN
jgi:hypothetical protein